MAGVIALGASLLAAAPAQAGVARLADVDRFGTAAAISRFAYPDGTGTVILVSGRGFADAIGATAAAAHNGGSLLLTDRDVLPAATRDELARLEPGLLFIVGGTDAVSDAVAEAARSASGSNPTLTRIAGADRYATAAAASNIGFQPGVPIAFLATGTNYPDALAGGAAGGHLGGPVLLTPTDRLHDATRAELARLDPQRIIVLGGPGAVSHEVLQSAAAVNGAPTTRIAGADRVDTSALLSREIWPDGAEHAFVASGAGFADALAGGVAAGRAGAPVLLVERDRVPAVVIDEIQRLGATDVVVLGGPGAVSDAAYEALERASPPSIAELARASFLERWDARPASLGSITFEFGDTVSAEDEADIRALAQETVDHLGYDGPLRFIAGDGDYIQPAFNEQHTDPDHTGPEYGEPGRIGTDEGFVAFNHGAAKNDALWWQWVPMGVILAVEQAQQGVPDDAHPFEVPLPCWLAVGMGQYVGLNIMERVIGAETLGISWERLRDSMVSWQGYWQEDLDYYGDSCPATEHPYALVFAAGEKVVADHGEHALRAFWTRSGSVGAEAAFEQSFDITLAEFYAEFRTYRETLPQYSQ